MAGKIFYVGNRRGDWRAVLFHEIGERTKDIINLIARKNLRDVLNSGGGVIKFRHDRTQIWLLARFQNRSLARFRRGRRAERDGHKILSHQAGELDDRLAVGLDHGVGFQFHRHIYFGIRQRNAFHTADFYARHFHAVAGLQILRGFKLRVDVIAAAEKIAAAQSLDDGPRDQHRQHDESAEFSFK